MIGFTAGTIKLMIVVMYPIVIVSSWLSKLLTKKSKQGENISITEDEIRVMIKMAQNEGVLDSEESACTISCLISMIKSTPSYDASY